MQTHGANLAIWSAVNQSGVSDTGITGITFVKNKKFRIFTNILLIPYSCSSTFVTACIVYCQQ